MFFSFLSQINFPVIFNKTIEDSFSTVSNLEDQLELSELLGDRIAHQSEWTTRYFKNVTLFFVFRI